VTSTPPMQSCCVVFSLVVTYETNFRRRYSADPLRALVNPLSVLQLSPSPSLICSVFLHLQPFLVPNLHTSPLRVRVGRLGCADVDSAEIRQFWVSTIILMKLHIQSVGGTCLVLWNQWGVEVRDVKSGLSI
jgi:hypothetical protein